MDDIISKEYGSTPKNDPDLTVEKAVTGIVDEIVDNIFKAADQEEREKVGLNIPELDLTPSKRDEDEVNFEQDMP